jgi:hypothetical protein
MMMSFESSDDVLCFLLTKQKYASPNKNMAQTRKKRVRVEKAQSKYASSKNGRLNTKAKLEVINHSGNDDP